MLMRLPAIGHITVRVRAGAGEAISAYLGGPLVVPFGQCGGAPAEPGSRNAAGRVWPPGGIPVCGQFTVMVNVVVVFSMLTKLLFSVRPLNVADPTAGPWPASGSGLAQMPKPDLALNWSPLGCAPVIVVLVNVVSCTELCAVPPT